MIDASSRPTPKHPETLDDYIVRYFEWLEAQVETLVEKAVADQRRTDQRRQRRRERRETQPA
jgi:hypothetical protein